MPCMRGYMSIGNALIDEKFCVDGPREDVKVRH